MRIITLSEEEFDRYSSTHNYNTFYQSSDYADFANKNDGYSVHYLGFIDDNSDELVGASLMLYKTLFWGYKYAYAPRGLLIDYNEHYMVEKITNELKRLLKKQKFIFITIDPLIVASERDRNGKIIQFNNSVNRILNDFQNNNYEHLGFNIYNETILPRWNVVAKLNRDGRTIFNNFDNSVKEKISYCNNIGMEMIEDTTFNIDEFYSFVKKSYSKSGKKYFINLYEAFKKDNKLKIFYARLNTKKYATNVNKLYAEEEERNLKLAEIIQSGDKVKYNIQKAVNDRVASDKLLHTYKKDIVNSTKLLKSKPDGITCGVVLTIEDARGVNIFVNYVDNDYAKFYSDTFLTYEIMKYYGKMDYKYINIGAVTGNFDSGSKYYPILENKLGFNSSILEYIGQFNMIINPTMYKIYKRKYHK